MEAPSSSWSDLLPDLLGIVLFHLPLPDDRARFRAVCRGWHSAARQNVRQLPWIVFPDGSFGTIEQRGIGFHSPTEIIPGLPDNVTCLGAAAVGWLALDCTDDVFRRTHQWDKFSDNRFLQPRHDVKHRHSYRLYNPFTRKTVMLRELDSVIGEVAETFDIRKVLMRRPSSDSPEDELVAITTNSYNYSIIICRPGKGICVLPNIDVFDVAFHRDKLYGITPQEELVVLDLAEDDKGAPIVTECRRVIKKPLADGEEDHGSLMYDDSSDDDVDDNDGELSSSSSSNEDEQQEEEEEDAADDDDENEEEEASSQNAEDIFNGDGRLVPSGEDIANLENEKMPFEVAIITRRLVQSSYGDGDVDGELLMVRHHTEFSPGTGTYTMDVDILKADMEAGNWVPVNELAEEGKVLFLSRSFSKSIRAYGDIKEGFVYYTEVDDVFDTKSRDCSLIRFPRQWEGADHTLLTWLFPPALQL